MKQREHRPDRHGSSQQASRREPAVAPGKRTLTMALSSRGPAGAAPVQRKLAGRAVAPARGHGEPVEDWMRVALRPDLYQTPIMRDDAHDIGYAEDGPGAAPAAAGRPMPTAVQARMAQSFGADFSAVRVHEGPHVQAMGALAYTQGNDIHFAPGQYDPGSQRGLELLGHELTHVVQQGQGRVQATTQAKGLAINDEPALEREADELGARAARGESVAGMSTRAATDTPVQAKLSIGTGGVLSHRSKRGAPITLPPALIERISERFGSQKDRTDKIRDQLQDWAEDESIEKHFDTEDEAVLAAGQAVGLTVLNVYKGDEQPLYEYGKNYGLPGSTRDPSDHDHTGIAETSESREKAMALLSLLENGHSNPPDGFTPDDFLPADTPYMFGVLVTNRGVVLASKSGGPAPRGFVHAVETLGYRLSVPDVKELAGFNPAFDSSVTKTEHKQYGHCALPKALSGSSDHGGYPTGVTEVYFSPKNDKQNVSAVGENGEYQQFHHGTVVPSCDTCRKFSPEQLKGLPKRKTRSGGHLRRALKPGDKNRKQRHGKQHGRQLRDTIDEGRELARHWDDLDEGYDLDEDLDYEDHPELLDEED